MLKAKVALKFLRQILKKNFPILYHFILWGKEIQ